MGAICGFSGPPDQRLLQPMLTALAHRGVKAAKVNSSDVATIAYLPRGNEVEQQRLRVGLRSTERDVIGIAGLLTDQQQIERGLEGLLAGVRAEGVGAIERLLGDFVAVALLMDSRDRWTIYLVRDASGARTVYHAIHAGRFFFASEPKAIWSVPEFPRRIRAASLAQYLAYSFVPGPATMLEHIEELPAGHSLTLRAGECPLTRRYFFFERDEFTNNDQTHLASVPSSDADAWAARIRQCLAQGIRHRLPADEPPAVFLSGGLDSSVVTCELTKQSARQVHSYALHFGKRYPNELDYAEAVARHCGTRHREVEIRPREFLPQLRQMIWHLDDPIGDPITMPNMLLAQRVAEKHRWVFNGEGGDPCFGGPKNTRMLLGHWYGPLTTAAGFRERAYLSSYRRGYELIDELLASEWRRQVDHRRDLEAILTPFFDASSPRYFLNKLFAINIRLKGAHLILPKVERMLAAARVTPLAPLFSAEMVRLSFQMPPLMKMAGGDEKVALKRAYANLLPREIIVRPKSGMRVPVHFWFQGELRRYARSLLSPRNVRRAGVFNPTVVKDLLAYNLETRNGRYGLRLWMLLTFEIWRRIVVEGETH